MSSKENIRQSNFELMRIVSMFFVVLCHVISNSNIQGSPQLTLLLNFVMILINIHVNSFILATGYFQCDKEFKKKRVSSIINMSWFYRIIITILLLSFGMVKLTNLEILQNVFILPLGQCHWYIHYYILLYLLSPYLNKLINSIDQITYKKLICITLFIGSILSYSTNQMFFHNGNGFSLYHFIFLYLVGGYLKRYPIKESYHFKNLNLKKFRIVCVSIFFICVFSILSTTYFGKQLVLITRPNSILREFANILLTISNYDFPITILQSIVYFLLFSTLDFKSKIINKISSYTLGIYLIHETTLLKPIIYDYFKVGSYIKGPLILLNIAKATIIIFILSMFVEAIRQFLLETFIKIKKFISKKTV